MPELPEVETVRRGLVPVLEGQRLVKVEARRPDLRFALPDRFVERLEGATVSALTRRAKYLVAELDSGEALIAHLGMSGRFSVVAGGAAATFGDYVYDTGADPKHDHVVLHLEGGAAVVYNDPRRFGFMDIVPQTALNTCKHFANMGPEPLSNAFDGARLFSALKGRKSPIKQALLDQATVAGLGNIYVCEALYRAHISPMRAAQSLTQDDADRVAEAIRAVLSDALLVGGSTLRDFASTDGSLGGFQERFDVYGQEGKPCHCGDVTGTVIRTVQSGRSTFHCPACQH